MICSIQSLPEGKNFSGIIIKEENGHRFITPFNNNKEQVKKVKENLIKTGAKIVEMIEEKDKHYIRKKILKLNKEHNLPGVNSSLKPTT